MQSLSEIDLGSTILSISILLGFIGTGLVVIRMIVLGINNMKVKSSHKQELNKTIKNKDIDKGFN